MKKMESIDFNLAAEDMPTQWYNFLPDLPKPIPDVQDIGNPRPSEIMEKIRPKALLKQNSPSTQWVDIPKEILERLVQIGRPTSLRRARQLEKYLKTPARIYYKREDSLLTGSFKLNTAVAQAYYCKEEGREHVISETGAGQWGMSIALASQMFGLKSQIFMARCSLEQKPYRKHFMQLLNTEVSPSPSLKTKIGRELLAKHPDHPGSIGTAISEAIEATLETQGSTYLSGSNINHVHLHQSLLGLEVKKQLTMAGETQVDELIACVSGGSNLCGFMMPFLKDKLSGKPITFLGAESTAAPRLTRGTYEYCRSDLAGYTPLVLSYSMGRDFIPEPVHVGGLRQHNSSPLVSMLRREKILDAVAYTEYEALKAGQLFLMTEGLLIAPESSHAVAAAIQSATQARNDGIEKVIVILCSGNGFLDLKGYHEVIVQDTKKYDYVKQKEGSNAQDVTV